MAERKQFLLRIDPQLWAELEAWAADELRSVNGQIEYVLREATRRRRGTREKGLADERPPAGEAGG
jgi:hypothetical protein